MPKSQNKKGTPIGVPRFCLAAGAIAAVAAQVSATGVVAVAAATAEQDSQDDDPPNTIAAEAITVTHNRYLRNS